MQDVRIVCTKGWPKGKEMVLTFSAIRANWMNIKVQTWFQALANEAEEIDDEKEIAHRAGERGKRSQGRPKDVQGGALGQREQYGRPGVGRARDGGRQRCVANGHGEERLRRVEMIEGAAYGREVQYEVAK